MGINSLALTELMDDHFQSRHFLERAETVRVSAISRVGIIAAKYARLVIALSFPLLDDTLTRRT